MQLFCSHCGTENESTVSSCKQCGQSIGHVDEGSVTERPTPANRKTAVIAAIVCAIYLVYPSFGLFELIPDATPIIGSLDEAAATTGLWIALSKLGLNPFAK